MAISRQETRRLLRFARNGIKELCSVSKMELERATSLGFLGRRFADLSKWHLVVQSPSRTCHCEERSDGAISAQDKDEIISRSLA